MHDVKYELFGISNHTYSILVMCNAYFDRHICSTNAEASVKLQNETMI